MNSGVALQEPAVLSHELGSSRLLVIPLALTALLASFTLLPAVRQSPRLLWSFLGTCALLALWNAALLADVRRRGRILRLEMLARKQHYLQACAQGSVLLYWGWYWRQVYDSWHLIAAQLVFAYAFDLLLAWSQRETYALGFGPFPVVFSTNLFLWFKPDWFYFQFLMIAVGFAAKDLIRWDKGGRRTHIFNPSSFPLSIFSLGLIVTGTTDLTWGQEIAITQFNPPHIYLMIFLVGLPGQFLFGVTPMTMSAVVTTYACGLVYFAATDSYFFFDTYVPIAVFLGMHLLFTDPSTSPRSELGRIIFGMLYGLAVVILAALLDRLGVPTFYDKLLPVPALNLLIKRIDRLAGSNALKRLDPAALGRRLAPRQRHLAYMTIWSAAFAAMSSVQAVGDEHPGHSVRFWRDACRNGVRNGCRNLAVMNGSYCVRGSGWACNEVAIFGSETDPRNMNAVRQAFQRSCDLGFLAGCDNLTVVRSGGNALRHLPPRLEDYPVLLQEGKAAVPDDLTPLELYERACRQGWADGCREASLLYARGEWAPRDEARASKYLRQACTLGLTAACGAAR
jgi:hypothetical protein